jgi:HPt (histidine-containing phosphotransfer) domain-containing protein
MAVREASLLSAQLDESASADAGGSSPPLDLAQLEHRCMGRLDLVERLLASFERRFPEELLQIEQSLAEEDAPRLTQLAHQLKGASANVAAPLLAGWMQRLERAAQAGCWDEAGECLSQLQSEWERFTEYRGSVCTS